jgi:hypothetical protein
MENNDSTIVDLYIVSLEFREVMCCSTYHVQDLTNAVAFPSAV